MKKLFFLISITSFFSLIQCCKKDDEPKDEDYRNKYIGTYNFTTFSKTVINHYENGVDSMYSETKYDTINYIGTIALQDSVRIKIEYLPNATEPILDNYTFPIPINGLIYPVVNDSGVLNYPEITKTYGLRYSFIGRFSTEDSLIIEYGSAFHVGSEEYVIHGVKLKQ